MTGRVYLVGIGPGNPEDMTPRAIRTIKAAAVIIGSGSCLELIIDITSGKELISEDLSPIQRAEIAAGKALDGTDVAIVTTGDPGTYAIASTFFSYLKGRDLKLDVTVIPGLPAANVASALLGSPAGHDFAAVSLADQASPWEKIKERLETAAKSDFVIILYNPKGKLGSSRLTEAITLLNKLLKVPVPVGIVTGIDAKNQEITITTLDTALTNDIDSQSVVIVGNSRTFVHNGRMVTPRDYIEGVGY